MKRLRGLRRAGLWLICPQEDGKTVVFMDNAAKLLADDQTMTKRLIIRDGLHLTPRGQQTWAEQ